jgi:zinc D-Ala-D-Ala carboxypeptidase
MKISEHLDLSELTRSESAKRNGISNMPTPEHIENLKLLAETIFEPIRDYFKIPIRVSSGYRSKDLNAFIKGSSSSQHCKGQAIDIDMDGTSITNKEIFDFIKDNLPFDQLIYEFGDDNNPDWVHVSYVPNGRRELLKAFKINKQTKYFTYA